MVNIRRSKEDRTEGARFKSVKTLTGALNNQQTQYSKLSHSFPLSRLIDCLTQFHRAAQQHGFHPNVT